MLGVAQSTLCTYELRRRFPTLERAIGIEEVTGQEVRALDLISPKKKKEIESIKEDGPMTSHRSIAVLRNMPLSVSGSDDPVRRGNRSGGK